MSRPSLGKTEEKEYSRERENNRGKCQRGTVTSQCFSMSIKSLSIPCCLKHISCFIVSQPESTYYSYIYLPKTTPKSACTFWTPKRLPFYASLINLAFAVWAQNSFIYLKWIDKCLKFKYYLLHEAFPDALRWYHNILQLFACLVSCSLNEWVNEWMNGIMYKVFKKWQVWRDWDLAYLRTQCAWFIWQPKGFQIYLT